MVETHLEQAAGHLSAHRTTEALRSLLEAWRLMPDPVLADLVDALSPKAEAVSTLEGLEKSALHAAWLAMSSAEAPACVPQLLRTLRRGSVAEVAERLESLSVRPADPRVSQVLVGLVAEVPFSTTTSKKLWTRVFKMLSETRDARVLQPLEAACARPLSIAAASLRDWMERSRLQALDKARASVSREKQRPDPDLQGFCARLQQAIVNLPAASPGSTSSPAPQSSPAASAAPATTSGPTPASGADRNPPQTRSTSDGPDSGSQRSFTLKRTLLGHPSQCYSAVASPSGRLAALAAWDTGVYVVDTETGEILHSFFGESGALAFSSEDRWLVTTRGEQRKGEHIYILSLWDLKTGKKKFGFDPVDFSFHASVHRAAFHPQDATLALGMNVCSVLWNPWKDQFYSLDTREKVVQSGGSLRPATSTGDDDPQVVYRQTGAFALAFSPDGRFLATMTSNLLEIWDPLGNRLARHELAVQPLANPKSEPLERYVDMAFHPIDGSLLVVISRTNGQSLERLRLPSGPPEVVVSGVYHRADQIRYSTDGTILACRARTSVRRLDPVTGQADGFHLSHGDWATDFVLAPHGCLITVGGRSGVARWDLETQQVVQRSYAYPRDVESLVFSPDSSQLMTGADDGAVWRWDLRSGAVLDKHCFVQASVDGLACAPDGQRLLAGHNSQIVYIDPKAKGARFLKGHRSMIKALAFTPDGTAAASASADKSIRIWNLETEKAQKLDGHTDWVVAVAFSPEGKRLYSASRDTNVIVWDFVSRKRLETYPCPEGAIQAMALTESGNRLILGTSRGIVVQDATAGANLLTLPSRSPIVSVAVSEALGCIASGDRDGIVKVWDLNTGDLLQELPPHAKLVQALRFSPDGRWLVVGNGPLDKLGTVSVYARG